MEIWLHPKIQLFERPSKIRSEEMHRVAEFGVAAHWDYKLQGKALPDESSSDKGTPPILALPPTGAFTSSLTESKPDATNAPAHPPGPKKGRVASYIEALAASRESIVRKSIFVFLSSTESALDGRIVGVDPSSSCADVLEKYGSKSALDDEGIVDGIADGTLEVYRNGARSSLDAELRNGDVLTFPRGVLEKLRV